MPAATTVPLPKDGPVHDVQWSPAGDYFVTVAGFMPAKVGGEGLYMRGCEVCGVVRPEEGAWRGRGGRPSAATPLTVCNLPNH